MNRMMSPRWVISLLQGGVALQVLAVLVERRRANRLQLAAGERGLEDGGGVDRALRGTRADEIVELVDEQDDVAALGDLLHHLLEALLELADLLGVRDEVEQDAGGDALVLADQPEQDVLGADVVVTQAQRFAQRELQHLLRARRERDLAGRHLVTLADDARDLSAHFLDGDVEGLEHVGLSMLPASMS